MKPLSQTLNSLILFTEETLTQPARHASLARDPRFSGIAAAVREADAKPAESVRCTQRAHALVLILEAFFASPDREPTSRDLMAAGTLLPLVRGEAWQALWNEKEQSTTTEEYRR